VKIRFHSSNIFSDNLACEQQKAYMDDGTLSEILSTAASHVSGEQIGKMQLRLEGVVNWSNSQDMVLNGKKCKEMIIDFRTKKTEIPELQIQEIPVERVNSFNLLGL
jgi:hypothetical protein